ncbi:MAG: PTS sugar transporter subunit IIA [Anaerolineaceae bacterium]|nr:PTS sugar transporter subunit IIA [Anaerolineaceae bacterium]
MIEKKLPISIDESNIIIGLKVLDSRAVIQKLGQLLFETSYIKKEYIQAVIEREIIYPTGLKTINGYVAIPHADSVNVKKTGIAIATLSTPVIFKSMENGIEEFPVSLVMMLAIKDKESVVKVLQRVISILKNERALSNIQMASEAKCIRQEVLKHIEEYKDDLV